MTRLSLPSRIVRVRDIAMRNPLYLGIAAVAMALAYLAIDPWHDWGGDFAYYLTIARNEFRGDYSFFGVMRNLSPSGFPEFLELVGPPVGFAVGPLKLYNLIWLAIHLAALAIGLRAVERPEVRLCTFLLAALSMWVSFYANRLQTEMPFLAISTCVLALALHAEQATARRRAWLLAAIYAVAMIGCALRQAATLLIFLPPLLLAAAEWRRPRWLPLAATMLLSGGLLVLVRSLEFFTPPDVPLPDRTVWELIVHIFGKVDDEVLGLGQVMTARPQSLLVATPVTILIVIGAVRRLVALRIAAPLIAAMLALPFFVAPWTAWGGRYWFPMIAVLLLLFVEGCAFAVSWTPRLRRPLLYGVTGALLASHLAAAKPLVFVERDRGVYELHAQEMFTWVHYNTTWGSYVCSYKPRILAFYANWRQTCGFPETSTPEQIEAVLAENNGRGVIGPPFPPETLDYFRGLGERVVYDDGVYLIVEPPQFEATGP